jgi:hypothetical protein
MNIDRGLGEKKFNNRLRSYVKLKESKNYELSTKRNAKLIFWLNALSTEPTGKQRLYSNIKKTKKETSWIK